MELATLERELRRLEITVKDETQQIGARRRRLREMRAEADASQREVHEAIAIAESESAAREALAARVIGARKVTTEVTLRAMAEAKEARLERAELAAKEAAKVFQQFDVEYARAVAEGEADLNSSRRPFPATCGGCVLCGCIRLACGVAVCVTYV